MKRSHRVALTAGAASALVAGATGALALGPLDIGATATAAAAEAPPPAGSSPVSQGQTDLTALHEAISRLSGEATALQADLAAAQRRVDAAMAAAGPSAIPRSTALGSRVGPTRATRSSAPTVHTRTGASTATGHEREESEDD